MSFTILRKTVRATGGTETDEFAAKIKSVTSSTTIGSCFIYDTRSDSDGGAWRKKCAGLSWFDEDLNTATRGGRREFPSVALIVADNDSANTVTIYDLDDPAMPMWMVFNAHTAAWETNAAFVSTSTLTSVHALNGRMYVGGEYGLVEIDFLTEQQTNFRPISSTQRVRHKKSGAIVDRNDTSGQFRITATPIANNNVNDVSATIVEGSELGALGLPIPTVAVATAGGASVIHGGSGAVYDISSSSTHNDFHKIFFTDDNRVGVGFESNSTYDIASYVGLHTIPYADNTGVSSSVGWSELYNPTGYGGLVTATAAAANTNSAVKAVVPTSEKGLAIGYPVGLAVVKRNAVKDSEGMVANITSDYTTGYQIGAAKGTWLTGGDASTTGRYDRSVGNTDLVENGTVLHAAAETDAEVTKYYDFSASNYFSQAHNSDFDFTGDFSVTLWFKDATTSDPFVTRLDNSTSACKGFVVSTTSGGLVSFAIYTTGFQSSGRTQVISGSAFTGSLGWKQLVATRRSGKMYLYIDGVSQGTPQSESTDLTDSDAPLGIGIDYALGTGFGGSLSLVRISATAPTPQQVKEIYEAEKPLFRAGAKCLLQHSTVHALDYDKSTDLLSVGQTAASGNEGVTKFRGLENVAQFTGSDHASWSGDSIKKISTAGGVSAFGRTDSTGGVLVDLPAIDVRGDINTADTKLPDDGKLHFSGVTASTATPTVIGHIPLALGDKITVKARVQGHIYQYGSLNGYYEEITATFQRPYDTGTVAVHTSFSNPTHSLSDSTLAGLDVELSANDTAKTCEVKVTGSASYRMQWNATVEVQRISEKTYER